MNKTLILSVKATWPNSTPTSRRVPRLFTVSVSEPMAKSILRNASTVTGDDGAEALDARGTYSAAALAPSDLTADRSNLDEVLAALNDQAMDMSKKLLWVTPKGFYFSGVLKEGGPRLACLTAEVPLTALDHDAPDVQWFEADHTPALAAGQPVHNEPAVHPHLVVVGRVIGDQEDSVQFYEGLSQSEAVAAFENDMAESEGFEDYRAMVAAREGEAEVFINNILVSDAPIRDALMDAEPTPAPPSAAADDLSP